MALEQQMWMGIVLTIIGAMVFSFVNFFFLEEAHLNESVPVVEKAVETIEEVSVGIDTRLLVPVEAGQ